jgi:hypothetical protein
VIEKKEKKKTAQGYAKGRQGKVSLRLERRRKKMRQRRGVYS